jgi:hypothetical protein
MTDFDTQTKKLKPVMMFFAVICAFSTTAAAMVPFVVYA